MKLLFSIIFLIVASLIENATVGELKPFELIGRNSARAANSNICYCKDLRINCDLKTVCVSDCKNQIRYADEIECVFPFQYKGIWYDTCTDVDMPGHYWCSLDKIFANKFANCEEKCPYSARKLVVNDIGKNHTSCRTPANEWVGVYPTDEEIKTILDLHNNERSIVSPAASNMRYIFWDFSLARLAMNLAVTSDFNHDCSNCRKLLNNKTTYNGQNLYRSWGAIYDPKSTWASAVNSWISEKKSWKYGNGSIDGGVVGHYTQVVNAESVRIGCAAGVKSSTKDIIAACNYATGQYSYATPYIQGTPCTGCGNCINSNLCSCNKICQNGGTLNLNTCTCSCPVYANGDECEILTCDKTDIQYGCWFPNDSTKCVFSNIRPLCPNLCGMCTL